MRFGELFAPGTRVFQVDVAPSATHPHVGGYVRGDAATVASAVLADLADLQTRDGCTPSGWRESVDVATARRYEPGTGSAPDGRLDPRSAAARIGELLPDDRVVVSDGGHFIAWANMYWPVAAPDRLVMVGTAFQAIGLGFPSVLGAALARPASTVVLSTGDGGGLMALADLESAVRVAGGRGVAVVWNDAEYGAEVHVYGRKGLVREPMLIPAVDFAGLATAVGAQGVTVRTLDDLDALAVWAARPASQRPFLLLDLLVSPDVVAPYWEEIVRASG
jgi:thiamine pyrophosphate-dependent acetolactate synthase large subunit-like protein